jgi:hypothetical protein
MTEPPRRVGQVVAFDEWVGLGEIDSDAGGPDRSNTERFGFHCTQLADGSRTVAVGTPVDFRLLAGRGGHWEAADIRRIGAGT